MTRWIRCGLLLLALVASVLLAGCGGKETGKEKVGHAGERGARTT
jgi:hypothetical protein